MVVGECQHLERDLKKMNNPVESRYKGGQKETPFWKGRWPLHLAEKRYKIYSDNWPQLNPTAGNKKQKEVGV